MNSYTGWNFQKEGEIIGECIYWQKKECPSL